MNNTLLQVKFKQRLNKLSSEDYENLECWAIVEAFNKGMDAWVRRQLQGINQTRTGAEGSTRRIDDLQTLLTDWKTSWTNKGLYWESNSFPTDYLQWCRISAYGQDVCKDCPPRYLNIYEGNEADVILYLNDVYRKPDYDWATTFSTIAGNKFRIWTDDQFSIVDPVLTYYRSPAHIQIANCTNPDTGTVSTIDVECELPDSVTELIIDESAGIMAFDMDNMNQGSRLNQQQEHST